MGINLSSILTPLTNARAGYLSGERTGQQDAANQSNQALVNLLKIRAMQQQEQSAAVSDALKRAQTTKALQPGNIDPLSQPGLAAQEQLKKLEASLKPPTPNPVTVHAANRDYDVNHPLPVQPNYTPVVMNGETGQQPVIKPFDTHSGVTKDAIGEKPEANGIGGSASAQTQRARLLAAVSEARLADERMRAYEDKLLGGQTSISPMKQAAGSLTANLADSHSPFGALLQAGSEFGLNKSDPGYAQYLRDAATIGRAEQMMSPRGGNETMVRANALLSRAGTGAMANTIEASRMARQALFGKSGGIAQSLTPEATDKLEQGVQSIKRGETGSSGNITLGPNAPKGKPISAEDRQHAANDPAFAKWLKANGYQVP